MALRRSWLISSCQTKLSRVAVMPKQYPSVADREVENMDDAAVAATLSTEDRKSVLPGPPIPPRIQEKLRRSRQQKPVRETTNKK